MGFSTAKPELYFIYVLRLESNRWYVGSTKNITTRMESHFSRGGAIATRECCPVSIAAIYRLTDYQIRTDCAHERAEVMIAIQFASQYGCENVRGAKHGKSWADKPSPNNLRDIERYKRFANTADGKKLLSALECLPVRNVINEDTQKRLTMLLKRRLIE